MATDATVETFSDLTRDGAVLVDFWGPRCAPCLQLMPHVLALEEELAGDVKVVKVDASQNRQICRDLRVFGLPTYLFMRDGVEVRRISGDDATLDVIREGVTELTTSS
jgi:thioredoxin 1